MIPLDYKKGRDLFDLWHGGTAARVDPDRVVDCFARYLAHHGMAIRRPDFTANLAAKLTDQAFLRDIQPLLAVDGAWDPHVAADYLEQQFLSRQPA